MTSPRRGRVVSASAGVISAAGVGRCGLPADTVTAGLVYWNRAICGARYERRKLWFLRGGRCGLTVRLRPCSDARVCITESVSQGCRVGGTGVQRSTGAAMKQVNQVGVDVDSEELVCATQRAGQTMLLADVLRTPRLGTRNSLVGSPKVPARVRCTIRAPANAHSDCAVRA